MFETAAEFLFTRAGNGRPCLGDGWSMPEEHASWTVAETSHMTVPIAPGVGDMMLEIAVTPFVALPFFKRQRLGVTVNGMALGEEIIETETSVAFRLPPELAHATKLSIDLHMPDARSPKDVGLSSDTRRLGVAVREVLVLRVPPETPTARRVLPPLPLVDFQGSERDEAILRGFTGLSTRDLMMQLESLGHNCEFGLVQRHCGAEPHRLLRFVGITYRCLLLGLDFCFDGIDDPANLHCYLDGDAAPEYIIRNERYGLMFHSFQYEEQTTPEAVLARQLKDLAYRRRNFEDMLREGNRLFVFQRQTRLTEAQALPLLTMLRSFGRNALLFVTPDRQQPAGTVEMLRPDLFRGSIDRLAPISEAERYNLTAWVSLCANAYRLWRETGGGIG